MIVKTYITRKDGAEIEIQADADSAGSFDAPFCTDKSIVLTPGEKREAEQAIYDAAAEAFPEE